MRIWVTNSSPPVPGLAMTRSIGDKLAATIGVTAQPDIISHRLTPEDKFFVMASDGIWEFLSSEHVIQVVGTYWEKRC